MEVVIAKATRSSTTAIRQRVWCRIIHASDRRTTVLCHRQLRMAGGPDVVGDVGGGEAEGEEVMVQLLLCSRDDAGRLTPER